MLQNCSTTLDHCVFRYWNSSGNLSFRTLCSIVADPQIPWAFRLYLSVVQFSLSARDTVDSIAYMTLEDNSKISTKHSHSGVKCGRVLYYWACFMIVITIHSLFLLKGIQWPWNKVKNKLVKSFIILISE